MTLPEHRPLRSTAAPAHRRVDRRIDPRNDRQINRRTAVLDSARRPFPAVAFLAGAVLTLIVASPAPDSPRSAAERITRQPVGDEAPSDNVEPNTDAAPAGMNAFEYVFGPDPMRVMRERLARAAVAALRDAPATSTLDDDRNLVRAAMEAEVDRIAETWHLVSPGRVWSDGDRIVGRGLAGPPFARMKVAAGTRGPRLCDDEETGGGGTGGDVDHSGGAASDGREPAPNDSSPADDEREDPTLVEVLMDAAADGAEDAVDATQNRRSDRESMIDAVEEQIVMAIREREDNTSCRRFQNCGYFVYDERLQCWYDLECDPNDYGASSDDGVTSDPASPRCRPSDPDGDGKPG